MYLLKLMAYNQILHSVQGEEIYDVMSELVITN